MLIIMAVIRKSILIIKIQKETNDDNILIKTKTKTEDGDDDRITTPTNANFDTNKHISAAY